MSASPLAGLQVLDLSRHLPGPLAAHLLADLGARVIKVEEPGQGDPVRLAPPYLQNKSSLAGLLLSGTESIALDLKKPGGSKVVEALLARSDVLLETFRPGTLARLGFPPEELRTRFPRLVIASLSGWGQDGPYSRRAGHDLTYQAVAGTLAPTAGMPALPVADVAGAWSVVTAILAALYERQRTGAGTHLDASLLDAGLHANLIGWAAEAERGHSVGETLPLTGAVPCYNLYRTADGGWLAVAALEPPFWERFCRAVDREDLIPHQYSFASRWRKQTAALIASRTREEWRELLIREDLPAEPVLSAAEARRHPQVQERDLLRQAADGLPRTAFPVRFDGERPAAREEFPELGGRTAEILRELDLPEAGLSGRRQRALGIGRRFSWKRWLLRWRR